MKKQLYLLLLTTVTTLATAQTYSWQWAKAGGGDTGSAGGSGFYETRDEMIRDVVVDNNNNSYHLTAIYPQNPNINGTAVTSYHQKDLLLFSLDCQGNLRWSTTIGGYSDSENAWKLAVDNEGGLYMMFNAFNQVEASSPSTMEPIHFDPTHTIPKIQLTYPYGASTDPGFKTSYLLKYNTSTGNLAWSKPLQGNVAMQQNYSDNGVWYMDSGKNIHAIVGFLAGTHFNDYITVPANFTNAYQYYLIKFNYDNGNMTPAPNPLLLPISGFLSPGIFSGKVQMLYDEVLNRYYVAGSTSASFQDYQPLSYNDTPLSNDGYVLAFDGSTGTEVWRKEFTTSANGSVNTSPDEKIYSLIKDSNSNIYLSGRYFHIGTPAATFGTTPLPYVQPGQQNFVMKMDPSGNILWTKIPTSNNMDSSFTRSMRARLAINVNEIAFVKGTTLNEIWDSFSVTSPQNDQPNSLLVRLNKDTGNAIGLHPILSAYGTADELTSVAVDNDGNYVVGGYFHSDIFTDPNDNIPTISYNANGKSQFYVAKLAKSACSAMATTETELDSHISFYPNPTQDEVQVSTKDTPKSWEIYGMTGQIVSKGAFNRGSNRINMSQLATGTYMVKVETEKGTLTGKVIKK
ncbi:T9SS type A sorting domain-containing protein [Chryseobacterium sp.]|uniref:T9SS type A sorting domain-containing protein n=1 Tax=Chryseobacterium sp. TaxID=1871047 RepID=UPI0012A7A751|nr:T9SS type A sorting domain-containing protein [Chryseobacterium sp.]QFG53466.1 T9SS type A sorting domain-containing protein [Chryseobacterium sp.]